MIKKPDSYKRYHSSISRFLKPVLINFFRREFPRLLGPILCQRLVDELLNILNNFLIFKDTINPGQVLWYAVDKSTRADSRNCKLVPVVLTLINQKDCEQLSSGVPISKIAAQSIARMTLESYSQGALLSMRDIELLTWRTTGSISQYRKTYEKQNDVTLPHTGTLHDMGSCITHKIDIVRKIIIEAKDPRLVAKETNHSLQAVDKYIKDYYRVKLCYEKETSIEFIVRATGIAKHVVIQYIQLINLYENTGGRHLAQI